MRADRNHGAPSVVVLAGGRGARLGRLTDEIPKPLVEVGGRPILWHVLACYKAAGVSRGVVAAGYRAEQIQQLFAADATVEVVDTGVETNTGGRVLRLADRLTESSFCLTYGDGVSDLAIAETMEFHVSHGRLATITAVHPPARFGRLSLDYDSVVGFAERSPLDTEWINGGFMVFQREVMDFIAGDNSSLEHDVLPALAAAGELKAFRHKGFWQCMDTVADVAFLNSLWKGRNPPWRTW
ncbi:sugar phosphate nucleotidyltransferase [Streptomyces sp. NPDC049597]|uniref:sugar phosphate nucleotidyltransferase n=1 Tax=Streptomyces sp. NPDC049597 TaxID=3155276 RepID=UPI003421715E